jgi:23S rRNA pseudouridine2605 synthase
MIAAGRVTVDGERAVLGRRVDPEHSVVAVDGTPIGVKAGLVYYLLNKPDGVISTAQDPHGRPTVVDLVEHESRVLPVGRLDADTTGVLLLTNDGELAHRLAHPRYEVDKVYEADVEGEPSDEAISRLEEGVELEDGRSAPAKARRLAPSRLELAIHEGRKHQVKRMLEAVGHPVTRLHRSRYAGLTTEGVDPGKWRELTDEEVSSLRELTRRT